MRDNSGGVTHNAATINGNLTVQTVNKAVKSVSTTQTMDSSATYWHTTGAITLTLPLVSAVAAGREYVIYKTDGTTTLTINTSDSTTINGASTVTATTQYTALTIWTDGVNWMKR